MKFLLSFVIFGLFALSSAQEEDDDAMEVGGAIAIDGKDVQEKRALGRIYTGSACEYIKLSDITANSGCVDGTKFVIKKADTVRKQLLIMSGTPILAFVTKGTKFVACTSFTEVTMQVDCKTVDGLSDVDLSANSSSSATTTAEADDEVVTRVKGYIDAGTCGSISSSSSCGDSATSYYKEITYNGKRVVISNQVPDHDHENDQLTTNPNEACERYQFIELPLNPAKGSSATRTGLGTIGLAVTGGAFFNDWSSPSGDIALYNEGASLDSCFGHSASGGAYHYHANINCSSAGAATGANDPDTCKLIGYYQDGVPVYGLCKDSAGMVMTSCYECTGTCTSSVTTVGGTYSGLGTVDSDYTYSDSGFTAGTCNLDSASGAVHPTTGEYSYFATVGYPWVPIYFYGDQGTSSLCSAA